MAANQPLVSIGMPVYNGEAFIRQSLDALLAQDYKNFELIISDNASTDDTAAICREYADRDRRIQYHRNEKNIGSTPNFKKVLDLARGRYFMWAGAHDLWHPSFISSCIEVLGKDLEVVLAYPQTLLIDANGNTIELMNDHVDTRGLSAVERFRKLIWELGYCNMFYGVFRPEIMKQMNFDPRYFLVGDNIRLAGMTLHGAMAQIPRPLFYRRETIPGETPEQARERRIAAQRRAGYEYEAMLRLTFLVSAHLEIIKDSDLTVPEKTYLSEETIKCFIPRFGSQIQQEIETFIQAMKNISFDALPDDQKDRLQKLINIVKLFSPDAQITFKSAKDREPLLDKDDQARLPFISIVIPTYNRADYLQETINSALAQQYEHMEILIVDDGSTDNTEAVISEFTANKIRYLRKEHSGAPATRNLGVKEAKGDFILWLGSDDVLLPETIAHYISLLKQFPEVDVFYGNLLVTDNNLKEIGKIEYQDWFGRNAEFLAKMFLGNSIPDGGSLVRRDCFERVGLFDESFKRAHDYEWWTRLIKVAKFKHAPIMVYKWRWHNSNMSSGSVNIDWSYDAKIIHLMLERYPLPELFPQINFSQLLQPVAEGLAYIQVAQRLLVVKDLAGALKYLEKSHELHPSGQTYELIQGLKSFSESADSEKAAADKIEVPRKPAETFRQIPRTDESPALPLVSVIVPTYNRPDTLVATLQSILNQTYQNHEIIVVNDCGLDVANIVDWCNQQGNISYVRHDHNRGLAAARNTGLKLARGKYIAYLDDDDVFYPDHLETLVNFLETSDFRVAYTDAHRAHQEKQRGRYVTTHKDLPYSKDFDQDHLFVVNQFPVLCLMHERDCLEKAGFFDETLTTHEDWDLWIRLSLHYPFQHIKKVTCEFTWRQDGSTMTSQKAADFVRTLEIIHGKYQEHLQDRPHLRAYQRDFLQRQREALTISTAGVGQPAGLPQDAGGAPEVSH